MSERQPFMEHFTTPIRRAESHQASDPTACGVWLRIFAERAASWLVELSHQPFVHAESLRDRIGRLRRHNAAPEPILQDLDALRETGNAAAHGRPVPHVSAKVPMAWGVLESLASTPGLREAPRPPLPAPAEDADATIEGAHVQDPDGIYLVRDSRTTTAVRVKGGSVSVLADRCDRLLFGEETTLWEWQPFTEHVPILAFNDVGKFRDALDEKPASDFREHTTWFPVSASRLVDLRTGHAHPGNAPAPQEVSGSTDSDAADSIDCGVLTTRSEIRALASVGRFVLRFELHDSYFGGNHNLWSCAFSVFDTVIGAEVDLLAEVRAAVAKHPRLLNDAWKQLEGDAQATFEELEVTLFSFRFRDGGVHLDCQLTTDACHAVSDQRWHDYTRSTYVQLEALPEAFANYARIPNVAEWFRQRDPLSFAGWSVLDLSMEEIIRAQLLGDDRFA